MKDKLTKAQSDNLFSLGIEIPNKVAIHTGEMAIGPCNDEYAAPNGWYIPISITDLLEILPKEIDNHHSLNICYIRNQWWAEYISYITEEALAQKEGIELIDSLYELCVWCLTQGYLKFE